MKVGFQMLKLPMKDGYRLTSAFSIIGVGLLVNIERGGESLLLSFY